MITRWVKEAQCVLEESDKGSLTSEGAVFFGRCLGILAELRDAQAELQASAGGSNGKLRIGAPVGLGRAILTPLVPEFQRQCYDVRIEMFLSDALADLEDMGLDFAVRIGELVPHRLGKFRLGTTRWVACASPEYLRQRGAPRFPDDLVEHDCVAYVSPASGRPHDWQFSPGKDSWSFKVGETARQVLDHCDALVDAAVAGAGVIYLHDYAVKVHLDDGTLVRVLEDFHTPGRSIHAVYPRSATPV